ncbi:MAG: hypothetical protein KKI12_10980 [Proteobacteria bacterium]|nr:hypothetical protein [Pseudomonadota bacterium]
MNETNNAMRCYPQDNISPLFQTTRYNLSQNGGFNIDGGGSNAGLTSYSLELICNSPHLFATTSKAEMERQYNIICSEAIFANDNTAWWRWEKYPSRKDYLYPIDWDDQFKAMDAIRAYENKLKCDTKILLPRAEQLIDRLFTSVYRCSEIGEDIRLSTNHKTALYMFDESDGKKIGNKEDIFVSAVVLESASRHGLFSCSDMFFELAHTLLGRLVHVAQTGLSNQIPFHTLSRCYISWAHYLVLLNKISANLSIEIPMEHFIYDYRRKLQRKPLTAIEKANELDDAFYRNQLGIFMPLRIDKSLDDDVIVYRHRRLSNFFSANVWTSILKNKTVSGHRACNNLLPLT